MENVAVKEQIKRDHKFQREILKVIIKLLMKFIYRVKVINEDKIPPKGKAVLCSLHGHLFDGPLVRLFTERDVYILVKQEMWNNKILGDLLESFGCIGINREKPSKSSIKKAIKVLMNDKILGIFPEGTRNGLAKGEEVKQGAASLAINYQAPIIPVYIAGDFKKPFFNKIKLIYGSPFYLTTRDPEEGTAIIIDTIKELGKSYTMKKSA